MKKLLTTLLITLGLLGFNSLTFAAEESSKMTAQEKEMTQEQAMDKDKKKKKKKGADDEEPECD